MSYLTKSRFILATECPTKLRYCDDPAYANATAQNEYLLALAESGHQVGALATTLFPDGIEVAGAGHDEQLARTQELMQRDAVSLFEAAFSAHGRFVRVDLLNKQEAHIDLYEVKAKSFDARDGLGQILGRDGLPSSGWAPYLYDALFQRELVRAVHAGLSVSSHLVLVNKAAVCSIEGANQKLRVVKRGPRRVGIDIHPSVRDGALAKELLCIVAVDDVLDRMLKEPLRLGGWEFEFSQGVEWATQALGHPPKAQPGRHCRRCQFTVGASAVASGLRDGRSTCWREAFGDATPANLKSSILSLYSHTGTDVLVEAGTLAMDQVEREQLGSGDGRTRLKNADRQWLQCEEARGALGAAHWLEAPLREAMDDVRYPIHFIDFENAAPAIPFRRGRRPYEVELFQFSHHLMEKDGSVRHAGQALEVDGGNDPNLAVLRSLRAQLIQDDGTIVHWWSHERTVLSKERDRLLTMPSPPDDRDQLVAFIEGLLGTDGRPGRLLDLGKDIVHRYLFLPGTMGRSSIKVVLPVLIASSHRLQALYGAATYGAPGGTPSLNFTGHQWIARDGMEGRFIDPYALLGQRFDDPDLDDGDGAGEDEGVVQDGGAAMVAYGLLQGPGLNEGERVRLRTQLLRYCELDTLAMVMAWQALEELLGSTASGSSGELAHVVK